MPAWQLPNNYGNIAYMVSDYIVIYLHNYRNLLEFKKSTDGSAENECSGHSTFVILIVKS